MTPPFVLPFRQTEMLLRAVCSKRGATRRTLTTSSTVSSFIKISVGAVPVRNEQSRRSVHQTSDGDGVDGWCSSTIHKRSELAATAEEQVEVYSQWASTYDEEMSKHKLTSYKSVTAKAVEFWVEPAGESAELSVLDAGCGTGILGAYFRTQTALSGLHLTGLDLCPDMLQRAEEKKCYEHLAAGNLKHELPFAANQFDQAISSGVFLPGHVGPEAITNILRVVKPGGMFITTVREAMYEAEKEQFDAAIESSQGELLQDELMAYYGDINANVLVIRRH